MILPGLVSVSFRTLKAEEIIELAGKAHLAGIEWGADVHAPPDDLENAKRLGELTRRAGLRVFGYGTYFKLGSAETGRFEQLQKTAVALGASVIRIWAGERGSALVDADAFAQMARQAAALADRAARDGLTLSLECHPDTLTDDYRSTLRFLRAVGKPNLKTHWQPNQFKTAAYNEAAIQALRDVTTNLHVFHWRRDKKYPLQKGSRQWTAYLAALPRTRDYPALLEFMHNGAAASLPSEAMALREIIRAAEQKRGE